MSTQTHHIKSLLFELEVGQEEQARKLQAEMSHVWRAQIMPLLEKCLDETGDAGTVLRIDSLELDLGSIAAKTLNEEMLVRLEQQLRRELAKRRNVILDSSSPEKTDIQSNLELLAVYARNGCLTWWANPAQGDPINTSLDYLLQQAPAELARMMREFTNDERSITRIIYHCDDRMLSRLGAIADASQAAALERFARELLGLMRNSTSYARFPARDRERRKLVWLAILRAANQPATHSQSMESFWRNVLLHMAVAVQSPYDKLVTALDVIADRVSSSVISAKFRQFLEADTTVAAEGAGTGSTNNTVNDTRLGRSASGSDNRWAMVLHMLERFVSDAKEDNSQTIDALHELTDTLIREICPPPAGFAERLRQFDSSLQELFDADKRHELETLISERPHSKEARPLESIFNEVEEAYVDNAGLVLLWPFLQRFFGQLELLENKSFKDAEASQRAVGLLQYLVTGEAPGPEYLLPLNKVLCGMKPADVFDFGSPLNATERDECTRLLEAVIEHASILRNMSIEGLRGTFLLRKGILESRDGAWLLRVERETFDVVLERFPWSFNWVKLPWMTAPMCVEW